MIDQVKDVDGLGQGALKQHPKFFNDVRFRKEGCKPKAQSDKQHQGQRQLIKDFHGLHPQWKMARLTGLEPATPGVTGRYSNQLSYNRAMGAQYGMGAGASSLYRLTLQHA